jgi:hypothetical protein
LAIEAAIPFRERRTFGKPMLTHNTIPAETSPAENLRRIKVPRWLHILLLTLISVVIAGVAAFESFYTTLHLEK